VVEGIGRFPLFLAFGGPAILPFGKTLDVFHADAELDHVKRHGGKLSRLPCPATLQRRLAVSPGRLDVGLEAISCLASPARPKATSVRVTRMVRLSLMPHRPPRASSS